MERLAFSEALGTVWALVTEANKLIEAAAPWKLFKEKKSAELAQVIGTLLDVLKAVAQAAWPFVPATAEALWSQLGLAGAPQDGPFGDGAFGAFRKGGSIAKGAPLFPKREAEAEKTP
jgi:methionyl-tRNA synthetase